jgi:HAD superfamily hydrolase (TIGR01509 family)
MDRFAGVIFDLDGTIIDSMWMWKQIDIDFLAERNLEFPENLQKEIEGMSFSETAEYFKRTFDLKEDTEELKEIWTGMAYDFYKNKIPLKNGVREIIENFHVKKIPMGIGTSNTIDLVIEVLKKHDIDKYFKTIRTACEIGKGKPSPDIFLKVAEDLNVPPEKCLVFEDTLAGVQAGKNAGMVVYAIKDEISAPYADEIKLLADRYITWEEL